MVALVYGSDCRQAAESSAALARPADPLLAAKRPPAKPPGRRVHWVNLAVQILVVSAAAEGKIRRLCNGFSNCLYPREDENKGRATAMEGLTSLYPLP